MNFLNQLLQSLTGVNANPASTMAPPTVPPSPGPLVDEPELGATVSTLPERKGMFGLKGTGRDILGLLGDAFLVQGGAKPVYAPRREAERQGDAMIDFTRNPTAAFERLAAAGYGDAAFDMFDKNTKTKSEVENRAANTAAEVAYKAAATQVQKEKSYGTLAQMVGAAMEAGPEAYARWLPQLQRYKAANGLEGDIPTTYDKTQLGALRAQGMNPYQQVRAGQLSADTDSKIGSRGRRDAIAQQRADKPPAPRAPPKPGKPIAIKGPDGKPVYVSPEEAVGKEPYYQPRAAPKAGASAMPAEGTKRTVKGVVYIIKNGKPVPFTK